MQIMNIINKSGKISEGVLIYQNLMINTFYHLFFDARTMPAKVP